MLFKINFIHNFSNKRMFDFCSLKFGFPSFNKIYFNFTISSRFIFINGNLHQYYLIIFYFNKLARMLDFYSI
jgi:hypothetical protein